MTILVGLAYLCGSVPFGKLIAARYGIDIQKRGSGNIGFANVRRIVGWRAGLLTLAGDITKGVLPTALGLILVGRGPAFWIGLVAIVGHLFPIWLQFRGGKGIATGLGVMIVLQPWAAAIGGLIYVAGCLVLRNSAFASLAGIGGLLAVGTYLQPQSWWQFVLLLAIALWTLRKNISGTVPDYGYDASAAD